MWICLFEDGLNIDELTIKPINIDHKIPAGSLPPYRSVSVGILVQKYYQWQTALMHLVYYPKSGGGFGSYNM